MSNCAAKRPGAPRRFPDRGSAIGEQLGHLVISVSAADGHVLPLTRLEEAQRHEGLRPGPIAPRLDAAAAAMARLCLRVGSILTADMADHTVTAQVAASEDIIADLAIALAAPDQMPALAGRRRVAQAISLMHDRHREPITLASLARELGCRCRSLPAKRAMRRRRTFWPGSGWTRRGSGCCRAGTVSPPRWTAASAIWAGLPLPIAAALAKDRRRPCPQGRERRNGEVSFGMAARQDGGSILGCAGGLAIRRAKIWRETGRNHAHGNCVLRRQFRWLRLLRGQSLNHTALTPGAALTGQRTALARRFLVHCDLKAEPPMKPHPSANEGGKIFFFLPPDKARLAPHCTSRSGRSALRATETEGGTQGRRRTGSIVPHQRPRRFEFPCRSRLEASG